MDPRGRRARSSTRHLLGWLKRIGCAQLRCRGSHATWRLPSGATVTIPIAHLGRDVSANVLADLRRKLRALDFGSEGGPAR